MRDRSTPLGVIGRGLVAGAIGTAALTAYQTAAAVRRGESLKDTVAPEPPASWEEAPASAQVGYRFLRGVFQRDASPEKAPAMTNAVHWAYGTAWGAVYAVLDESVDGSALLKAPAFGSLVFANAYVALPAMKLYDPPWEYSARTLATDWSYHVIYGGAVALAYRLVRATRS